jgi:hypothetical protein
MSKIGFVLAPLSSIVVTVKFSIPVDSGAKSAKGDLDVTFKRRSVSEQKEFIRDTRRRTNEALDAADGNIFEVEVNVDTETLLGDILDVKGLQDDKGKDVLFTETVLADLLEIDFVRDAIMLAWQELNFGKKLVKELKAKN